MRLGFHGSSIARAGLGVVGDGIACRDGRGCMFLRKAGKGVVAGVRARGEDHSCMCDARAVAEEVAEVVVRAKNLLVEAGVVRACTDVGAQVHATVIVASLL